MKLNKFVLSSLSATALALSFSACSSATNPAVNNANVANKSNVATIVNSNQAALNNTTPNSANNSIANAKPNKPVSTPAPAEEGESDSVQGELQTGKTDSVILYLGEESGDYAAYCFKNDSEAGKAILAKCKDKEQCEVVGTTTDDMKCEVPGLEANLSASFRIVKAESVKSLGRRK